MIQDEVESFFSKIEFVFFSGMQEPDTVVMFFFNKAHMDAFSSAETHKNIHEYFLDRTIKFVIIVNKEGYTKVSLVDVNTGDTINFNTQFITGNYHEFIVTVPKDKKLNLLIASGKDKYFLMPQEMMKHDPVVFHGWSITYEK